jgi:hypothetical protein
LKRLDREIGTVARGSAFAKATADRRSAKREGWSTSSPRASLRARPEPFDPPLILSLSKDERSALETAWEEIEPGRYMPRRIRGSFPGRELG